MSKPFTKYLTANAQSVESMIASMSLDDPALTVTLENYQRIQLLALGERIEADFEGANRDNRLKLFQQLIQIAALQERTNSRLSRERAEKVRDERRRQSQQTQALRAQERDQRAKERAERDHRRMQILEARRKLQEQKQQSHSGGAKTQSAIDPPAGSVPGTALAGKPNKEPQPI